MIIGNDLQCTVFTISYLQSEKNDILITKFCFVRPFNFLPIRSATCTEQCTRPKILPCGIKGAAVKRASHGEATVCRNICWEQKVCTSPLKRNNQGRNVWVNFLSQWNQCKHLKICILLTSGKIKLIKFSIRKHFAAGMKSHTCNGKAETNFSATCVRGQLPSVRCPTCKRILVFRCL